MRTRLFQLKLLSHSLCKFQNFDRILLESNEWNKQKGGKRMVYFLGNQSANICKKIGKIYFSKIGLGPACSYRRRKLNAFEAVINKECWSILLTENKSFVVNSGARPTACTVFCLFHYMPLNTLCECRSFIWCYLFVSINHGWIDTNK